MKIRAGGYLFIFVLQFVTLFISQSKRKKAKNFNELWVYCLWVSVSDKGGFVYVLFS